MEPEKKSNGALIGLVVIIIILIIGGIYMWMSRKNSIPVTPATNQDSSALNTLEQEINATDTNIGVDVESIE